MSTKAGTRVGRAKNAGAGWGRDRSRKERSKPLQMAIKEARTRGKGGTANDKICHAIEAMVRRIVERFAPERIILFGSHARGEPRPDSDVDLLVVMSVSGSRREKAVEIGVALHDFGVPKDIVVTTPEDFAWRKQIPGTIERPAALEGRLLYARR